MDCFILVQVGSIFVVSPSVDLLPFHCTLKDKKNNFIKIGFHFISMVFYDFVQLL